MKRETYSYPKSSFLSTEKDMNLIAQMIIKNERLKKLLYYTDKNCLSKKNLSEDETLSLFGNQIKIIPKLIVDGSVLNYVIINFDNFSGNRTNPEFRDNLIEIDIVCHFNQWELKDFELRPYKIAAEIDSMLNHQRLTGIGEIQFLGAIQMVINDEFGGLCLLYDVTHGEEDKKHALNPQVEQNIINNFNEMFNT